MSSPHLSQYLGGGGWSTTAQATAILAGLVSIAGLAIHDYRNWYALGRGGLPHNWKGWLVQSVLRLFSARDTRGLGYYDRYLVGIEKRSFLEDDAVPVRRGPRPKVGAWVVPHRQLDSIGGSEAKERVEKELKVLGKHTQLEAAPSVIEGGCPALFVKNHVPSHPVHPKEPREFFHMHEIDGSMHCILSASDARLVLSRGWGERHALNGKFGFPPGYTLIFAPRNEEEQAVIRNIAYAAAQYGLDGEMIE